MLDDTQLERVLVITAHPDDVDFGAAGTVATLTDRGVAVTYCVVTDGDAGGFDPEIERTSVAGLRRDEQTRAAKEVGVTDLVFLGQPDGRVQATLDLRRALARTIRQTRPQLVITQSPTRNLDRLFVSHPDHLATGEAALCAVYPDARNPFAFPELLDDEGLESWSVSEVWLFGDPAANHAVDITDQVERKLRALAAHQSQLPDPAATEVRVRERLEAVGRQFRFGVGRFAEAFRVVDTG